MMEAGQVYHPHLPRDEVTYPESHTERQEHAKDPGILTLSSFPVWLSPHAPATLCTHFPEAQSFLGEFWVLLGWPCWLDI